MDLVEVIGKQNRKVPVLLTRKMKLGIDLLNSCRQECGVNPANVYVFAKGEESFISGAEALNYVLKHVPDLQHPKQIRFPKMRKYLATVTQGEESFISGAEALNYVLKHVPDLQHPKQIRFPKMRKYLATVTQVMGIDDHELQKVAQHMGHELTGHQKFYRLQEDVIELAKVSKLLLAVEAGVLNQFSGKTLDDIDLEDSAKKKWTADEKAALRTLVDKATLEQKPPRKANIQKVQRLDAILQNLKWTCIKHNVWAMAQQKRKECKTLLK